MNKKNKLHLFGFYLLTILASTSISFAASTDTLWASSLHPYGRFAWTENGKLELISSAVHFGFRFSGPSCKIDAYILDESAHNYLQYTLDGIYQRRIKITGNNRNSIVIGGLGKGNHTIWIYKATEAATGAVYINKIVATNCNSGLAF